MTCQRAAQAEALEQTVALLETANYPVRDLDQHAFGQGDVGLEATLYAASVDADELDRVMAQLERQPGVLQAFWNASAEH